nr:replication-relaxation family protein [Kibdelosporangium sp. MJ126-NF4]CEL13905.1 hypothetical protein [Kibdelosporangium sp. MJ126-NF4]CTQ88273.1 hypothetical protein [Kibdelosporangium sp. MJ126-NF4]
MSLWYRLVDRDRRLLALLAEHKVLTTRQVAAIEFTSIRRAQDRLRRLYESGVLFTFRQSYANGGTSETRFALGYVGKRLICALRAKTPPAPKVYAESLERLVVWPKLEHHLGVNDFFCDLAVHRNPARHSKYSVSGGMFDAVVAGKRCVEFFCVDAVCAPGGNRNLERPCGPGVAAGGRGGVAAVFVWPREELAV